MIRRIPCPAAIKIAGERWHLILKHRKRADMMDSPLLIERRDRLSANGLAATSVHGPITPKQR
jgi:hypothetical protein